MSSATKQSTLRAIVPKILAQRTITSLGLLGKVEANELLLSTGGLTIESVVRYIKDYTKLRDEIGQTIRQVGIERKPEPSTAELTKLTTRYSDAESQVEAARHDHQKLLSELVQVDKQAQEVEKQLSSFDQLKATGFSYDEMMSRATGFRRVLGRLPSKKLDAAQKALRAVLKDRTVMMTGAKRNDSIYLLVATPTDEASQTLQTLLNYDFTPMEMPALDGSDFEEASNVLRTKKDHLANQRQSLDGRLGDLRKTLGGSLNRSVDEIEETLLVLRGSLRLGEGTFGAHIFARLDKPPTPVTLNTLLKDGVMELD